MAPLQDTFIMFVRIHDSSINTRWWKNIQNEVGILSEKIKV